MDLKDFFSAAEARIDRWCEMNTVGRAWEAAFAQGHSADKLLLRRRSFWAKSARWKVIGLTPDRA